MEDSVSSFNTELTRIKSKIMNALIGNSEPLSLSQIIPSPQKIHYKAIKELVEQDRISSSGSNKWEIL